MADRFLLTSEPESACNQYIFARDCSSGRSGLPVCIIRRILALQKISPCKPEDER
jgi:hypothetical protein